jgi:hypothetical protein
MRIQCLGLPLVWLLARLTGIAAAPSNDDFANATVITGLSNRYDATLVGATRETDESLPPGYSNSVWWRLVPQEKGTLAVDAGRGAPARRLAVYEGDSLATLVQIGFDDVRVSGQVDYRCRVNVDVTPGRTYYIRAYGSIEVDFTLNTVVAPAPANDEFAGRINIPPGVDQVSGTTVGASMQPGETTHSFPRSVWWTWVPTQTGRVVLTTAGSACDTLLSIYTGDALESLVSVASNDDASSERSGPTNDPTSRIELDVNAGIPYQIAIASATGNTVQLSISRVAIAYSKTQEPNLLSSGDVAFEGTISVQNFAAEPTRPLRVQLVARSGNSHLQSVFFSCPSTWPVLDTPEMLFESVEVSATKVLGAGAADQVTIAGECPAPFKPANASYGWGWSVFADLEEEVGGEWVFRDSRLVVVGAWPVGGFTGPGGGVVTISSSISTSGKTGVGLDIRLGPPDGIAAGAFWRISSNSFQIGNLSFWTSPQTNRVVNLRNITSTNFMIEVAAVAGFVSPQPTNLLLAPCFTGCTYPILNLGYTRQPSLKLFPTGELAFSGTVGRAYRIEQGNALHANTAWLPLATNNVTSNPMVIPIPIDSTVTQRYFRAIQLP